MAGLEAASLFARLGAHFEPRGFEQWDAALGKSREQSKRPVLGKLGVHVDSSGFTRFDREMRQAATEKAMGRVTVDERPAQAKLNQLSKQIVTVKAEIAKGREMGLETGVARAQLRLLQGETRATEKEIARSRLGLDQQTKALGMEAAASRVGAAAAAEHTTRLGRFTAGLTAAGKSLEQHGKGMRSYGHEISGLSLPIAAAGAGAIKLGMDFQAAMERVHGQAGAAEGEVRKMSKAVLDMSPKTAHGPKELADALFHVESTGIRGAKALDVLKYAAIGANVGNAKLTDVTNALVGVLKTAPHDIHSTAQAMGLMNEIVGAGNMKMEDLVGAISTGVLPAAKNFGLGMRDVGASLDVMTARGIPAQEAATRLRMSFSLMAAPSPKAIKALKEIGLSAGVLAKDMRQPNGVLVAMQDLKRHLESSGKSASEQAAILSHAFGGGRSSSGILTLVQNTKDLAGAYHALPTQAAPALKKLEDANAQWEKTSKAHWDNARAAMETSATRIGTQLAPIVLPVLVKIAHAVEGAVSWFSKLPGPVKTGAVAAIGLTAVLGPLLILFGSLTVAVGRTIGAVKGLATAWRWVTGASKEAGAAQVVAGTEGEAAALKGGGAGGLLGRAGGLLKGAGAAGLAVYGTGQAANFGAGLLEAHAAHNRNLGLVTAGGGAKIDSATIGYTARAIGDVFTHPFSGGIDRAFTGTPEKLAAASRGLINQFNSLNKSQDAAGFKRLAAQADALVKKFPEASKGLNRFRDAANQAAQNAPFIRALRDAEANIGRFGQTAYHTVADIRDRYRTNMREIAATIGLNTAKGRELAAKNFDAMAGAIEHSMRTGRLAVNRGTLAMTGLWEHSSKEQRDILVTHYHRTYEDLLHALHKHRISQEQFNGLRAKLQQQANQTLRADEQAAFHKRLTDLDKAHASGHLTDKDWKARRLALFEDERKKLGHIQANLGKDIVTDADRAGRAMHDNWAKWFGNITGLFSGQGGKLGAIIGGIGRTPGAPGSPIAGPLRLPGHREGGLITGLATGGLLPGYGGGDRHLRMLEDGEFVIRKEAVAKYGVDTMRYLNGGEGAGGSNMATGGSVSGGIHHGAGHFTDTAKEAKKAGEDVQKGWGDKLKETVKHSLETTQKLHKDGGEHFTLLRKDALHDAKLLHDGTVTRFKDTRRSATRETTGLRDDVSSRFRGTFEAVADRTAQIQDTTTGRLRSTRQAAGQLSKGLRDDVAGNYDSARKAVDSHTAGMRSSTSSHLDSARASGSSLISRMASAIAGSMGSADTAVYTATGYVESAVDAALKGFGGKPVTFSVPKPKGVSAHATGGIPSPGASSRDDHLLLNPHGEPVAALSGSEGILNTPQMAEVGSALALKKLLGLGRFGSLGELWRSGLTHYAKGGNLGSSGSHYSRLIAAANKVSSANFPYVLGGGHEQPARFEPLDCSGAVSYVTQQAGYRVPTEVSGGMGAWGFPKGPGEVTVFYNGGHTFMRIGNRYFGTSGFARPGGGAGWFNQSPGAGYLAGFQTIHFPDLGAAGSGGAGTVSAPKVTGPKGALLSMIQAGVGKEAAAGNHKIEAAMAASANYSGQPLNEPGGSGPASGWTDQAMRLTGVGGGLWKQMLMRQEMRESSFNPNPGTINDINSRQGNPSLGILQTTGTTFRANMLPGHGNILNPVDNIAAAIRYMIATYGHGNANAAAQAMWARGGGAYSRGGTVGRVARFARGGFLTGGGQGQFGSLRPPSHHPIRRPHFAGSSQPHHGHHALHGHAGHAGHASSSQPHIGGAPSFIGDTRGLGTIPDLTGGPKATGPRVDAFLASLGLGVPGVPVHLDRHHHATPEGGSFLQALVGTGNIPGLSPLDTADLGVAGNANAYTQLEQHLTAAEPGGQLSEADYGQLLGVRTHGLGLLTGEQRTVAGEFHTVASAWMGRDKRLQALKAKRDWVLAAQTKAQDKLKRMQRQYARLKHDRRGRMLSEADRVAGDLSKNSDQLAANMAARRAIHSERGIDAAGERARIHAKYAPLIAAATGKGNRGRRAALHAAMAQELNALAGRVRGQAGSKKQRLASLTTEAARLSKDGKTIHQREAKARRKYARDGWAGAWSETTAKWRLQDKIKHLGDEAKKLQGSAAAHTGIAGLEGEEAQLVTAAGDLVQRAQQLPDAIRQGQADVATLAQQATTPQLLTPEQTNRLALLTEQQALAALTPDTADDKAAATGLVGLWQEVLTGLQSHHAAPDLITQAAQNLLSARQGSTGITDQVRASMTQFDDQQRSLFQTFGSNFIPTAAGLGSPSLGGFANFGAGGAAQSAAMGLGSAGDSGKMVVVQDGGSFVSMNHAAPADDVHSHAALSRYAFESAF